MYIGQCAGLSWLRGGTESPRVPVYAVTSTDVALSREFLVEHFLRCQRVLLAVTTMTRVLPAAIVCLLSVCLLVYLFACFLFLCLSVFPFLCLSICFLFLCLSVFTVCFLCLSIGLQSQNSLAVASSACYLLKCMPFFLLLFLASGVCYRERVRQSGWF